MIDAASLVRVADGPSVAGVGSTLITLYIAKRHPDPEEIHGPGPEEIHGSGAAMYLAATCL
jgi:hypothetical protein